MFTLIKTLDLGFISKNIKNTNKAKTCLFPNQIKSLLTVHFNIVLQKSKKNNQRVELWLL